AVRTAVAPRPRAGWMFLTGHAVVLLMIRYNPAPRMAELAAQAGVTPRTCQRIINDLVTGRYVTRQRVGRHNVYTVNEHLPLRLPGAGDVEVKALLDLNIQP